MTAIWDPDLYERFSDHRLRPARELLERIPIRAPQRVVDLGCGSGTSTRLLADRWPGARITGVDSSAEMLAAARATADAIDWVQDDIAAWRPAEQVDVIFSNAALHWLGGHGSLLPSLLRSLRPGGALAVQMPLSWHEPSHLAMRTALADLGLGSARLRERLAEPPVAEAAFYHRLLSPTTTAVDIWTTRYLHDLRGSDPVLDWVAGSGLRPILDDLGEGDRDRYLDEYRRRLAAAYPVDDRGVTLYPFPRLFIVALA